MDRLFFIYLQNRKEDADDGWMDGLYDAITIIYRIHSVSYIHLPCLDIVKVALNEGRGGEGGAGNDKYNKICIK